MGIKDIECRDRQLLKKDSEIEECCNTFVVIKKK
jgi:hypothetical protein